MTQIFGDWINFGIGIKRRNSDKVCNVFVLMPTVAHM